MFNNVDKNRDAMFPEPFDTIEGEIIDRRNRRIEERAKEIHEKRVRERLNSQLKPCPFCGGPAKIIERTKPDGYCSYAVKLVRCEACRAQTEERTADGYYGEYCSDEEIVECWNRRVKGD